MRKIPYWIKVALILGLGLFALVGFIGGLHKGNASAQALEPEIQLLNSIQPDIVAVSPHDSSPSVLAVFKQAFQTVYQPIQVGSLMQIP